MIEGKRRSNKANMLQKVDQKTDQRGMMSLMINLKAKKKMLVTT